MAISIPTKGRTIHDDLEHALDAQWKSNNGTYHEQRKNALAQSINAAIAALDVDGNNLHTTSFTIAATVTNASFSLTISQVATELSTGADRDGFNPFPGVLNIPGDPFVPGNLSSWKPYWSDVQIAYNYAAEVFLGTKDKTLLNLLASNGIGDRV